MIDYLLFFRMRPNWDGRLARSRQDGGSPYCRPFGEMLPMWKCCQLPMLPISNWLLAIGIGYWHHWQHSHRSVTRRRKKRAARTSAANAVIAAAERLLNVLREDLAFMLSPFAGCWKSLPVFSAHVTRKGERRPEAATERGPPRRKTKPKSGGSRSVASTGGDGTPPLPHLAGTHVSGLSKSRGSGKAGSRLIRRGFSGLDQPRALGCRLDIPTPTPLLPNTYIIGIMR